MNIREYIESGVLEAYILGALSEDEAAMVEANIVKFPELGDELLAIEAAMEQLFGRCGKKSASRPRR